VKHFARSEFGNPFVSRLFLLKRVKKIAGRYCVPASLPWRFSVVGIAGHC
jgi:hypothetical protein